jgi:hypothetical protein
MTNKFKTICKSTIPILGVAGLTTFAVLADPIFQDIPITLSPGGSGPGCPGAYVGYSKMTNSSGSIWITPPVGTTSGTLTDITGLPSPYTSAVYVARKSDLATWCDTDSVTFPATHSNSYQLLVFVTSTPAPTNGTPLILQIVWN